ncbi:hypothetical protein NQ318_005828 [Aromia moschata]|uniref:Uncharacterized protein n=1 Tax=Aromia moschata TaxID=1265417 RepID=A0AAV8YS62_9CUCU|nr:hypothetical protein NQ318_005828 [Aromia moschata]
MAPSPEDDNTPKAPDKNEKTKSEKPNVPDNTKEKDKDEKTLSNLNDGELKALLDEAITYKNPKDREGKSKLFKDLLTQAEESERIARAASAGGSELVRHCNPSARRNGRHRRKPSSISENVMHGGSLDNLAKEELFESTHHLHRTRKTVSARQREGGSLPCDVNSSVIPARDYQFLEEARRNKAMKDKEYTAIDMEAESLLEHDFAGAELSGAGLPHRDGPAWRHQVHHQGHPADLDLVLSGTNVDDPIPLELESAIDKKPYDLETLQTKVLHSKYSVYIPTYRKEPEEKKVDENGNALHQNPGTKTKKKKIQADKNVVVLTAESVEGHRSDIIDDVDKLIQYIGGDGISTGRTKSSVHKSKQLHKQHASEDGGRGGKKQRAHSSKGKEGRSELKKSNSLGEISTAKLDEFAFAGGGGDGGEAVEKGSESKVVLRQGKAQGDRPKERRSLGDVETSPIQSLYSNASAENLETAENWVVTKPKKKSKKRRNSISSGRRQTAASDSGARQPANRAPSPDLRGKSACSVPHSERSNDSSDVDSVHSLPIDGLNAPVSYADIAKNSERLRDKKPAPPEAKPPAQPARPEAEPRQPEKAAPPAQAPRPIPPPDVHNIKSFPAIPNNNSKAQVSAVVERANLKNSAVSGKAKGAAPAGKAAPKPAGNNNNNNNVRVNAVAVSNSAVCLVQYDIQNDLSIIHSNERESIQFNAQMLPPDIPDVQTIEKMHFLNRPPPPIPGLQHIYTVPPPPILRHPPPRAAPHAPPPPPAAPPRISPVADDASAANNVADCDSSERTVSGGEEEEGCGDGGGGGPPPVVILSGAGNKEVPGLVFGFDVNEQLLNEDICEDFISRYVAPEVFSQSSHNHDKIVNFIGSAWEAIVNQSNGKVQYYSEES